MEVVKSQKLERPKRSAKPLKPLTKRYPVLGMKLAERGMDLQALAKRLHVKRQSLSRALGAQRKNSALVPLACAELGVTPEELFRKRPQVVKHELPLAA